MKKIMMLIACVAMAVVASAASVDWKLTAGNMYASDGVTKYTGTLELFATGGDLEASTLVWTSDPVVNGTLSNKAFTTADGVLTAGEKYDFFYVITDGSKTLTSTVLAQKTAAATGATLLNWGNQQSYTQNAGNWSAPGVPEPTSGLLLLLGMAGLALKRKQA